MYTFPLEFHKHLIFCIIGVAFFLWQYFRQGYKYQLITAGAIASTFLLYLNDSLIFRYSVGILEGIAVIIIFITMSSEKKKEEQEKAEEKNANAQ
ncbi:MAG: hypothetical protein Q4F95_06800 [Oscillospiraceae bacterium]|nr:hypothetical protein [Oscillospiraceae bacterium]